MKKPTRRSKLAVAAVPLLVTSGLCGAWNVLAQSTEATSTVPSAPADTAAPSSTTTQAPDASSSFLVGVGIGLGAGMVSLLIGITLWGVREDQRADANTLRMQLVGEHKSCVVGAANEDTSRCLNLHEKIKGSDILQNVSVPLVVVGATGLAAGAAIAWLFKAPPSSTPPSASSRLRVAPLAGSGVGGLLLSGDF